MKYGKIENPEAVDFSLPLEYPGNASVLAAYPAQACKIYLAATGWSMPAWRGTWYPAKTKPGDMLRAYAAQFNAVELNTTQYRVPEEALLKQWLAQVGEDFRFLPKYPLAISRSAVLGGAGQQAEFEQRMQVLGPCLGPAFLQLPPHADTSMMSELERFVERCQIDLYLEFRHASWFAWEDNPALEAFYQVLRQQRVGLVCTDVAGAREVAHRRLLRGDFLLRFVGNALPSSDNPRLDAWIDQVRIWANQGLGAFYMAVHQPDNVQSPETIDYLSLKLSPIDLTLRRAKSHDSLPHDSQLDLF